MLRHSNKQNCCLAMSRYGQRTRVGQAVSTFGQQISTLISVDFLVGAGGGSPGTAAEQCGGGGAGGVRSSVSPTGGGGSPESALSINQGDFYLVQVGAGGAFSTIGVDSIFHTVTSKGGGIGGTRADGTSGGSGGGAGDSGSPTKLGGAGTAGQGFAGGNNANSNEAGGGGGAGGVGGVPSVNVGGAAGIGISNSITGSAVTYGVGGLGGGGLNSGGSSAANVSKGGDSGASTSFVGGSGVVILRYLDSYTITIGAGLTGTESASSGGLKRATITAGIGTVSFA